MTTPTEEFAVRNMIDTMGPPPKAAVTVSVVMPTYNRLPQLRRAIAAITNQTYPSEQVEIIVVSDGSTDGTEEYLSDHGVPNLVLLTQDNRGPAAARNRGVAAASGQLLVFVDDDVIATPHLIERHVERHRAAGGDLVVIGPMATPSDVALSPWVEWEQEMLYRQYDAMVQGVYPATPRQFYTGNASVPRACVEAAGGFDTRFRRAEDIELAYRLEEAGLHFVFEPEAIGYHHAERSFESWLQTAYDYGSADIVFARDHNRDSVGGIIVYGFARRPAIARKAISAGIEHPRLGAALDNAFRWFYSASNAVGARRLRRYALSGLYNSSYYRGVSDELGGAAVFHLVLVAGGASRAGSPGECVSNARYVWSNGRAVLSAGWYLRSADVVGTRVRLRGRPVVRNHGRMVIGPRVQLVSTVARLELVTGPEGTLEVGERTLLNYGGSIAADELVRIGARCLIGTHAIIMDNDFHRIEPERRLERPESKPIIIGDNVWIGARVTILGGTTIGDDSCIGAGSVVVEDIPPRSLAAGVPARVIRTL